MVHYKPPTGGQPEQNTNSMCRIGLLSGLRVGKNGSLNGQRRMGYTRRLAPLVVEKK